MDFQTLLVAMIVLAAVIYVGKMMFAKIKSLTGKSNCADDCGCNSKSHK